MNLLDTTRNLINCPKLKKFSFCCHQLISMFDRQIHFNLQSKLANELIIKTAILHVLCWKLNNFHEIFKIHIERFWEFNKHQTICVNTEGSKHCKSILAKNFCHYFITGKNNQYVACIWTNSSLHVALLTPFYSYIFFLHTIFRPLHVFTLILSLKNQDSPKSVSTFGSKQLVIISDFNMHVKNTLAQSCCNLRDALGLVQHKRGSTDIYKFIDLWILKKNNNTIVVLQCLAFNC